MLAGLQVDNGRGGGRQPHVVHFDDRLAVDAEVVTAGHLLPHVEEQGVVARLGNSDGGLEDVVLTHLAAAALGSGDIHFLAGAGVALLFQLHTLAGGVEVGEAVVVPQQSVALARKEHGDADLGVHLREAARKAADVGVAVLELAQSEQVFVGRGAEGQGGLAACQLMVRCGEHGLSATVFHGEKLPPRVNLHLHIGVRHFVVLHIKPVGQVAFGLSFTVLYSHGITGNVLDGELSWAEGQLAGCRRERHGNQHQANKVFLHEDDFFMIDAKVHKKAELQTCCVKIFYFSEENTGTLV